MVVGSGWEVIMEKKKIFIIVENHELLEGIAQQFEKFSNYQIVGTANSAYRGGIICAAAGKLIRQRTNYIKKCEKKVKISEDGLF